MKQKKYFILAAAAILMAACSENDVVQNSAVQQTTDEAAVSFNAYLNRGVTRAGATGTLTTNTDATVKLTEEGFGVFAYYGDGIAYGQTLKPDFFYNQRVTKPSTDWEYSPVKYWPNEFGTEAKSDGVDRLTFFAYAPWVDVTPGTGRIRSGAGSTSSGIIGLTSNTTGGDPYVKYCVDFDPENRVDLCWGVSKISTTSSVDGDNNNIVAGEPFIDVIKPKTGDKIYFDFKHALAALNVQIDADIDEDIHAGTDYLDGHTKIFVREITFEGFADKGILNLNSSATPQWYEMSTANTLISNGKVTIYDGRSNGKEGQANGAAPNEIPNELNEDIIQNYSPTTNGVPANGQVNLFKSDLSTAPIYVIPTGQQLKVTITYDVETEDDNLPGYLSDGNTHGSSIENKITKEITLSSSPLVLEAGKLYKVTLHLGMTSVKFDADVTDWPVAADVAEDTFLPINEDGQYAAGRTHTITVPASAATGNTLTLAGFTVDSEVSVVDDGGGVVTKDATNPILPTTITSDGTAVVKYDIAANTTFYKRTGQITITETPTSGDPIVTTVNFVQSAQALGLSVTSLDATGKEITLNSIGEFGGTSGSDWTAPGKTSWKVIKKAVDGSLSTITPTFAAVSETSAKVTLGTAVAAGEEYYITVQAGDAAAETVTVKIGGIRFPVSSVEKNVGDDKFTIAPIIYGNGNIGAGGWSIDGTGTSDVNPNTGEVTVAATAGSNTIKATLTSPGSPDGYYYTDVTKEATYTLTVSIP